MNEAQIQTTLFEWSKYIKELDCMYAIPNGGSRHKLEAINLKRQGVKAGVPDICLPLERGIYGAMYLELKSLKGKVQRSQDWYLKTLKNNGYFVAVCHSLKSAINCIEDYLQLKIGEIHPSDYEPYPILGKK